MNKKTKKGFTLVELIVVIAVLALLAVVAVPLVSSWVTEAKDGEAAANARTIELAMRAYMAEEGLDTIDAAGMALALTAYGIPNPIEGSSADYTVAANGSVTKTAGNGDISF